MKVRQGSGYLTGVQAIAVGEFHGARSRRAARSGAGAPATSASSATARPATRSSYPHEGGTGPPRQRCTSPASWHIGAGADHTCAVKAGGSVWCWGLDSSGQLGDGTTGDPVDHIRQLPVKVKRGSGPLTGIVAVAGGGSHTCARRSDGTVWCWGYDQQGQLGDGTTGDPVYPGPVDGRSRSGGVAASWPASPV